MSSASPHPNPRPLSPPSPNNVTTHPVSTLFHFKFGDLVSNLDASLTLPSLANFTPTSSQNNVLTFHTTPMPTSPKVTVVDQSIPTSTRSSISLELDPPFVPVTKKKNRNTKKDKRPIATPPSSTSPSSSIAGTSDLGRNQPNHGQELDVVSPIAPDSQPIFLPYHVISAKIKPFRRPSKARRTSSATPVLLPPPLTSSRTEAVPLLTFGSVEARASMSSLNSQQQPPFEHQHSGTRRQHYKSNSSNASRPDSYKQLSSNPSSSSINSQHEHFGHGHSHNSSHSHYNRNHQSHGYHSNSFHHSNNSGNNHNNQQSFSGPSGPSSHRGGPHYMGSNPHHSHHSHNNYNHNSRNNTPHRSGHSNPHSYHQSQSQQQFSAQHQHQQLPLPTGPGPLDFSISQGQMPGNQHGMMISHTHFQGNQPNVPGMAAQPAMYFMPSYADPQMNTYMYPTQMNHLPPMQQTYAQTPSQLLNQIKQQQSFSGGTPMPLMPNPSIARPTHSVSPPAPVGFPINAMPSTGSGNMALPPSSTTTVGGVLVPSGVNVPQGQIPQHVSSPQANMPGPSPHTSQPLPTGMISTQPSIGLEQISPAVQVSSSGSSAASNNPTSRPQVRISSKDNPAKVLTINDLTKSGLSERSPSVVSNTSVPGPLDVQSDAGSAAMNDDKLEHLNDEMDETSNKDSAEAKLLAEKRLKENTRTGSKALPIKNPDGVRINTPSPFQSPQPSPALASPPNDMVAERNKGQLVESLNEQDKSNAGSGLSTLPDGSIPSAPAKLRSPSPDCSKADRDTPIQPSNDPNHASITSASSTDNYAKLAAVAPAPDSSGKSRSKSRSPVRNRSNSPALSNSKQSSSSDDRESEIASKAMNSLLMKDQTKSTVCESPQSLMVEVDSEDRSMSGNQSPTSDMEEGELPTSTEICDVDEDGVYRYSSSRLYELCGTYLPAPPNTNLGVFGGTKVKSDHNDPFHGGRAGGILRTGSSRGGYSRNERNTSSPSPHSSSSAYGVGAGLAGTPTRSSRLVPPGAAAGAAIAAASGRSSSARGEPRRDGPRRGNDRDSGDSRRGTDRAGRRPSKRTNSIQDDGLGSGSSSPGMKGQPINRAVGVTLLAEDLAPLEKGREAWVSESIQTKVNRGQPMATNGDDEDEEAYCARISKQTRGLLNKLTPENLTRLQVRFSEQLLYPSALTTLCESIVRKSFDEPKYASLYASLTLYMYRHIVPLMGAPDNEDGFKSVRQVTRRLIIQSCQKQFLERPKWAYLSKGSITEEQFEEVVRIKSKVIGNMRFVGELYNYQVLSNAAIEKILVGLLSDLNNPAEEDLECLIMLMNTCLPYLRQQKGREFMNHLFTQIQQIVDNAELIPRIKFALDDLLSMQKPGQLRSTHLVYTSSPSSSPSTSLSRRGSHDMGPSTTIRKHARGGDNDSRERSSSGWSQTDRRSDSFRSDRMLRYEDAHDDRRSGRPSTPYRAGSNLRPTSTTVKSGMTVTSNAFAALAQDDAASEQSEEDSHPPTQVRSILTRLPGSDLNPNKQSANAASTAIVEGMTLDKAVESLETDMNAFLIKLDSQILADQLKRYPEDVTSAVLGRAVEIVMEKKKTEVAAFGKALALAVEQKSISPKLVSDSLTASVFFQSYEEMKCDIPKLDSFIRIMCEEMSTSIGKDYLQPILKQANLEP